MNIEHINLLIKKIDTAVALIENLKKREKNYIVEIAKLKAKNRILEKENLNYKAELKKTDAIHEQLESKIQEILQHIPDDIDEIEDVDIENIEIDDIEIEENFDKEDTSSENNELTNISSNTTMETEEERIKQLINNPDDFEKKGLFIEEGNSHSSNDSENVLKSKQDNTHDISINSIQTEEEEKKTIENETIENTSSSTTANKEINKQHPDDLPKNFEETLLTDENDEINLEFDTNIDSNADTEELPQGVM